MALTIGRITGLRLNEPQIENGAPIALRGIIQESTLALTRRKAMQLSEMLRNREGFPFHFINFDTTGAEDPGNGFYGIESFSIARPSATLVWVNFSLNLRKVGSLGTHTLAQRYYADDAMETIDAAWSALTGGKMVSMPYLATDIPWATAYTRTSSDGSNIILENPTRKTIEYTPSATLANWFLSECRIYDTMSAGDTTEANWVQVFDKAHVFAGDYVFQNGLLRYIKGASVGTWYVWDSVSGSPAWVSTGTFLTALTGNLDATIKRIEIVCLSADLVEWREFRLNSDDVVTVLYTLRRGAQYCRVEMATTSLGIDTGTYVKLSKAGQFVQLFNAAANGAAGAGALALTNTEAYYCGYKTTANIVSGFVPCDKPSGNMPLDPGAAGDYLPLSLTWTTSQTRVFFIIGWAQDTTAFNLTTGRANAAAIATHTRYPLEQECILIPRGFHPLS